jgi:hypothetical protein
MTAPLAAPMPAPVIARSPGALPQAERRRPIATTETARRKFISFPPEQQNFADSKSRQTGAQTIAADLLSPIYVFFGAAADSSGPDTKRRRGCYYRGQRRCGMRGILLWLVGIPIPVIILLYVFHVI